MKPEHLLFDKADAARLEAYVNETLNTMAVSTHLPPEEALSILENIHVEMVGELREAVKSLDGARVSKPMDSAKLAGEIEKAIEAISRATALDTDEITEIFSHRPGASLADVSFRLHARSQIDRERCS